MAQKTWRAEGMGDGRQVARLLHHAVIERPGIAAPCRSGSQKSHCGVASRARNTEISAAAFLATGPRTIRHRSARMLKGIVFAAIKMGKRGGPGPACNWPRTCSLLMSTNRGIGVTMCRNTCQGPCMVCERWGAPPSCRFFVIVVFVFCFFFFFFWLAIHRSCLHVTGQLFLCVLGFWLCVW